MSIHDRDKVVAAAKETGIHIDKFGWTTSVPVERMEAFYAIAHEDGRQAEREDCAKVSDHNLATYHQAAQKLRDEIATLKERNSELVKHQEATADKCDQLREQVSNQASDIASLHEQLFMGRMEEMQEALAATNIRSTE